MPRREVRFPHQVTAWLQDWGRLLTEPAGLILIGSAALLWHVARIGKEDPLPENSMDVDAVTESDLIAELAYDALIGSPFEQAHGWHVNLMPHMVLDHLPEGWKDRGFSEKIGNLRLTVPAVPDLMAPKLKRNEPRDRQHAAFAESLGLL